MADDASPTVDGSDTGELPTMDVSRLRVRAAAPPGVEPGAIVGGYTLVGRIGHGGVGVDFLARNEDSTREVAIKILRLPTQSDRLLGRFEVEAEALNRLRHPGIAQALDAGTATIGESMTPFLVTELVKGWPVDRYMAMKRLDARDRLRLLQSACDAVHHAHQKGEIHRNLCPTTILVSDAGEAKVLDFGVTRLANADIQLVTSLTDVDQFVQVVRYMSPEQAAGDEAMLDVRSDVYSLGVLLYEALAERMPYALDGRTVFDIVRVVREHAPAPLSKVDPSLRGDIEVIVAKALEKTLDRRYQSAAELSADIGRFLRNEPISARPLTAMYEIGSFVRRHTMLVIAIGVAMLMLLVVVAALSAAIARGA